MDWKRYGFIALIIIVLFGVVVLVGAGEDSPEVIIVSMLTTTIAVATPLTLGALSGIFCERAGVVNIGIEGMMLSSAFFGWFGAFMQYILEWPAFPCLMAGVLMEFLPAVLGCAAWLSVTFKVDQIIGGTVINLLAMGITGFLNRQIFFESGSVFGGQVPHAPGTLPRLPIPLLSDIPVFGKLFDQQPITWAAILLVVVVHFVLSTALGAAHSRWGALPRAITVGINVIRMRYAM
jgi:simple sugar transport system permease protein